MNSAARKHPMMINTFLEKFDLFTDTPDAVVKLKELVLQLAVRGMLVEQDSSESCLDQLGKFLELSQLASREEEGTKLPFSIPPNWGWVPLGRAMRLVNGFPFKPDDWSVDGVPIIRIQNLNNYKASFNRTMRQVGEKVHVNNGDFLISWSGTPGTSFGAFIWNHGFAYLNQHIFRCELADGVFIKEYLRLAVNARLDEMIANAQGAVGLQHITKGKLESIILTLPPLAEQKRIVAKVDELMALCDRLQTQRKDRDARAAALSRASLKRFSADPSPANLEFLFHPSYTVSTAHLRKAILELAVRGKLVKQEEGDEPFVVLLAKIVRDRELHNITNSNSGHTDRLEFEIPESWGWSCLSDLLIFGPTNGFSPKAVEYETDVRSLTLSATTTGRFLPEYSKFVPIQVNSGSNLWLEDGDILVQRGNTLEYVGVAAIYRGASNQFIYPDLMMKLRVSSYLDINYIHMAMSCEPCRDFLRSRASGTSGTMPKINQATLRSLPIPLPPYAEQKRIVAKVSELMALVDRLESDIVTSRYNASELLGAAIAELVGKE